jgi:hypothetical protein
MPRWLGRLCRSAVLIAAILAGIAGAHAEGDLTAVARDAYVYTFPLYEMNRVRYLAHYTPANPRRVPVNHFLHRRELADHTSRGVTTPNNDTLYSSSFLDLSHGPLVLEVPEITDRYFSLALMDFYTNNFAYVGTRAGNRHKYLIAGPGWKASQAGDWQLISSPTNAVWLLGRFLVRGASDLPRVHALQDSLKLYPLAGTDPGPPSAIPAVTQSDPWNYFTVVSHALTENPPPQRDAAIVARMATIGLAPGQVFDPGRFDATQRQALLAGVEQGRQLVAARSPRGKVVNGWAYPAPGIGNFGTDYLLRAATALKGLAALEPIEATTLSHVGEPLDGSRSYRLHFEHDRLPPAAAFWSLSIYEIMPDKRLFFADNPIRRYSIGDRTPNLRRNQDGSLDLYIRHASPGEARESNWLPAPAGPFALILRAYLPGPGLIAGTYAPPLLEREP